MIAKKVYDILLKEVIEVSEMKQVLEYYIAKRKGVKVDIAMPKSINNIGSFGNMWATHIYEIEVVRMIQTYMVAKDFLLKLHDYPEQCQVKVYEV